MHLLLTDRLACPRCGPEFGLILLAREMRDRRILSGELGCSNCREYYPVEAGIGDLRFPPRGPVEGGEESPRPASAEGDEASRLGALLGVTSGPGTLLLLGPAAAHAGTLADLISDVEVVGSHPSLLGEEEREGVSRLLVGRRIPFFSGSLRGVLLSGPGRAEMVGEAARVVADLGRVVVLDAPEGTRDMLEEEGLKVILQDQGVVVGVKEGRKTVPLTTLRVP